MQSTTELALGQDSVLVSINRLRVESASDMGDPSQRHLAWAQAGGRSTGTDGCTMASMRTGLGPNKRMPITVQLLLLCF